MANAPSFCTLGLPLAGKNASLVQGGYEMEFFILFLCIGTYAFAERNVQVYVSRTSTFNSYMLYTGLGNIRITKHFSLEVETSERVLMCQRDKRDLGKILSTTTKRNKSTTGVGLTG